MSHSDQHLAKKKGKRYYYGKNAALSRAIQDIILLVVSHILTLLLMNMTCPVLANSVDPDQMASEGAN